MEKEHNPNPCTFCRNHEAWRHENFDVNECTCNAGDAAALDYHLGSCYPQLFLAAKTKEMCPYYRY